MARIISRVTHMAYIPDLAGVEYYPASENLSFFAVGWLEPKQDYLRGEVSEEFFYRLCALLQEPWHPPVVCAGIHVCKLCQFSGGRAQSQFRGYRFDGVSGGSLFVPFGGKLFVAPVSVAHYVDAHEYCPPAEFQEAVMACPQMRSTDYMKALLATPAKEWLRRLREPSDK